MNNQVQAQSAANKSCRYQGLVELLTATSSAREEARFVATMRDDAFVFVIIDRPMGVVRPSFSFSFTRVVTQTQPHKAAPPPDSGYMASTACQHNFSIFFVVRGIA